MSSIYLVVGLGNPGSRYAWTRHNVGFLILDLIWEEVRRKYAPEKVPKEWAEEGQGLVSSIRWADRHRVLGVKPQTYMNRSGDCVAHLVSCYKVNPETQLLVIHDELDLPFGQLKLVKSRGPAGHNGIKDIHAKLGHPNYARLRVGIGKPSENLPIFDWVLSPFSKDEIESLEEHSAVFLEVLERWMNCPWLETVQFVSSLEFKL